MAKGPKFRLSILSSLQMCRPKDPSSLIKGPMPKAKYYSPVNSKSFDISIPSSPIPPPPSTPCTPSSKRGAMSSKISPLGCGCNSSSCKVHRITSELEDEFSSVIYSSKPRKEDKGKTHCDYPISSDSNKLAWTNNAPSRIAKTKVNKSKATGSTSAASSVYSGGSEEINSLFSSPASFTSSNNHSSNHLLKTIVEDEPLNEGNKKPMKHRNARTRRFKRFGSKDWKDGVVSSPEREEKPVSVEANQNFVVVKKSVDPYKDFKKSMLEMILEKQIFEPKELEQLLMSFLSLNSRLHHKVIIEAFTEIWKEVFCG